MQLFRYKNTKIVLKVAYYHEISLIFAAFFTAITGILYYKNNKNHRK